MEDKIYSVSNINKYIKMVFDKDTFLSNITVQGEITNFKAHSSGHLYFTLKDEASTIKCIMFRSAAMSLKFRPKDGDSVIIKGAVRVYEVGCTYQLYVRNMTQAGIGALYEKYEELKQKLEREGLFDVSHKKQIPFLPRRVGVITSPTGAVIRDIINVSTRRFSHVNLLVYPAAVQGENVASTVINGIRTLNKRDDIDCIIIARGGGSFEDLFGFNDENLAREIYMSRIPIVSAVGHETDFTICDFVSDLRAPTPSAAAELVYPSEFELKQKLNSYSLRLNTAIGNFIARRRQYLEQTKSSRLEKTPRNIIARYRIIVDNFGRRIETKVSHMMKEYRLNLEKQVSLLDSYSPLKTMVRGYSVVVNVDNKCVKSINDVASGDKLRIKVTDGEIKAIAE